jgi:hypothetical protein
MSDQLEVWCARAQVVVCTEELVLKLLMRDVPSLLRPSSLGIPL